MQWYVCPYTHAPLHSLCVVMETVKDGTWTEQPDALVYTHNLLVEVSFCLGDFDPTRALHITECVHV